MVKLVARDFDPDRPINTGVSSHRATHQLYNLSADPNEQENLLVAGSVASSVHAAAHRRFTELLRVHVESTKIHRPGLTKKGRDSSFEVLSKSATEESSPEMLGESPSTEEEGGDGSGRSRRSSALGEKALSHESRNDHIPKKREQVIAEWLSLG